MARILGGRTSTDVQALIHNLRRMADEMDKRVAAHPDAEMSRLVTGLRTAEQSLVAADQEVKSARSALDLARRAIDQAFFASRAEYWRGEAFVYARFGHQQAAELAAFGVRPSTRGAKRPRKRPGGSGTE